MATTNKTPRAAGPETRGLKVVARRDTFRRAGHVFGSEPKTLALSDLTEDQVDAIKGDSQLVVQEVDIEPAAKAKA